YGSIKIFFNASFHNLDWTIYAFGHSEGWLESMYLPLSVLLSIGDLFMVNVGNGAMFGLNNLLDFKCSISFLHKAQRYQMFMAEYLEDAKSTPYFCVQQSFLALVLLNSPAIASLLLERLEGIIVDWIQRIWITDVDHHLHVYEIQDHSGKGCRKILHLLKFVLSPFPRVRNVTFFFLACWSLKYENRDGLI
ncbi:hypothetical protein ACJX0J_032423, partial [Zea mays]